MQWTIKLTIALTSVVTLGACGMFDGKVGERPASASAPQASQPAGQQFGSISDFPILIGDPYAVGPVTHVPEDVTNYDGVGYGAAYAPANGRTATGEAFRADAISGAHKTLPIPSYVEVTAIDNGRTILVRLNDRGPIANDRIVALSPGAIAQLGVAPDGAVPVRVRRVNPPEQERAALREGRRVAERLDTPEGLLSVLRKRLPPAPKSPADVVTPPLVAPTPAKAVTGAATASAAPSTPGVPWAKPASVAPTVTTKGALPKPATGAYAVQIGAFSARASADRLAAQVNGYVEPAGALWRVRTGPYGTRADAERARVAVVAKGFAQARVTSR